VVGEVEACSDNQDDKQDNREQVDLAGVMIVMADVPAQCCFLPKGAAGQCAPGAASSHIDRRLLTVFVKLL